MHNRERRLSGNAWESNYEWMPLHEPSLASIMNVQLPFSNVPFLGLMRLPTRATGAEVFDSQSVLSSKLVSSFVDCYGSDGSAGDGLGAPSFSLGLVKSHTV